MTDDLHHLAAPYALDALEPDERARFEAHIATCSDCAADVQEFAVSAQHLAAAVADEPPAHLRDVVLARVAATPQEAPSRQASGGVGVVAAWRQLPVLVAALFILVALGTSLVARSAIDQRNQVEGLLTVLAAVDAQFVPLAGADPDVTLRVVWSPSQEATVVVGSGLDEPGADQVYELWVLSADGPQSAGTFEPDADGRLERRLGLPATPAAGWGVTVEPAGGSPQPTGEILFQG